MSRAQRLEGEVMVPRFSAAERWTHRSIAVLTVILLITAALLHIPDLAAVVGNRQVVRVVHEVAGFALPIPILLAVLSRAFRDDAGRLNRFKPSDWQWLRSRARSLGAIIVMLVTGSMMFFSSHFSDLLRTGATFVHDWLALGAFIVATGHIYMAFNDATARVGMRTGEVPLTWAFREHREWAQEQTEQPGRPSHVDQS